MSNRKSVARDKINTGNLWRNGDSISQYAEERLCTNGILIPWHYDEELGEGLRVVGLRAGGVGVVFIIESTRYGKKCTFAAKTLQQFLHKNYLSMSTEIRKKLADAFLQEALPWLEMGQHTHIVAARLIKKVIHSETQRIVPFVFSQWISDGNLREYLQARGKLELREALEIIIQINRGLSHAYLHGIAVHKDVKPENVMCSKERVFKVSDFGAGMIFTPGYASPEQIKSKLKKQSDVDHRADQFALGIMLLEMLKGSHPFPWLFQVGQDARITKLFSEIGVGFISLEGIPIFLHAIIKQCLAPKAKDRFIDSVFLETALLEAYQDQFKEPFVLLDSKCENSVAQWSDLADSFVELGRYSPAINSYKEALKRIPTEPGTEVSLIHCLMGLGRVCAMTGNLTDACANYEEALDLLTNIPEREVDQAKCHIGLGKIHTKAGKPELAEKNFIHALDLSRKTSGIETIQADGLIGLGDLYMDKREFSKAYQRFEQALSLLEATKWTEVNQAKCHMKLGSLSTKLHNFSEAKGKYIKALGLLSSFPGTEVYQGRCYLYLGDVCSEEGTLMEAGRMFIKALKIFEEIPGAEYNQAESYMGLGKLHAKSRQLDFAEKNYLQALGLLKEMSNAEREQASCLIALSCVYREAGQSEKEKNCQAAALALDTQVPKPGTDNPVSI
jgi:serine/threonine protein kinase/Tfp pilus assembly protein PilF